MYTIFTKPNVRSKTLQHVIFNDTDKSDEFYENGEKIKYRLEKFVPNTQHLNQNHIKQLSSNKLFNRRLNHDHFGFRSFDCQYK